MRGTNVGLDHHSARVGKRLRAVALAAAAASIGAVGAPALGQSPVRLPSTAAPPGPGPPLTSSTPPLELRFRGRIASSQRVLVELGPTGVPAAVRVRQRLLIRRAGDYLLSVLGPVTSVARAPP